MRSQWVYCASCAGQFALCGEGRVRYVLAELLGTGEEPDVGSSLANRACSAFLYAMDRRWLVSFGSRRSRMACDAAAMMVDG